ncbi:FYVE zinc finger-domain-containing protein [Panaeolus papilionaceus]|nr:FYVE zinc finger-domain-containing protein [Panaeolus papilionaceus]
MPLSDSSASPPPLSHTVISAASSASLPISISAAYPSNILRKNEHLALLLRPELWTPDSEASVCENVYCAEPFTLFNRRHHCRKCGGIFCDNCSFKKTNLLDASKLPFLQLPRNTPIATFDSPRSRVINCRVCNDCWNQLHGLPTQPFTPGSSPPRSLGQVFSLPVARLHQPLASFFFTPRHMSLSLPNINFLFWPRNTSSHSDTTSIGSSPSKFENHLRSAWSDTSPVRGYPETPERATFVLPSSPPRPARKALSHRATLRPPNFRTSSPAEIVAPTRPPVPILQLKLQSHNSFTSTSHLSSVFPPIPEDDELDTYPLQRPSITCKEMRGRWVPKPRPCRGSYSPPPPGCKAQWELDEEEEKRREFERQYRPNPIVCHGEIRYRVPKEYEPEPDLRYFPRSPSRTLATY